MCCGHAELSIRRELCGRWININHPHSILCQPAVVSSELINHMHFILFLFRIGCHVKLSVTYKLTESDELLLPSWLIQCVACIIIQHYFNPTRDDDDDDDDDNNNNNNNNNSNNNIILQLNCPPTLVVVSIARSFIFSIFLHSHKTMHKIFQFLITVYFVYTF
jgi:hypothetical protein